MPFKTVLSNSAFVSSSYRSYGMGARGAIIRLKSKQDVE